MIFRANLMTERKMIGSSATVFLTTWVIAAVSISSIAQVPTELVLLETHVQGGNGVSGLGSPEDLELSPDEKFLYVVADNSNSVAVFGRDPVTGRLTFLEAYVDGTDGIDGIGLATSLDISPDGKHVYVTGNGSPGGGVLSGENAVAVFARDETSGLLTFVEARFETEEEVEGLAGAESVVVSPDGAHVYVGATVQVFPVNPGISIWQRDANSGALTFLKFLQAADGNDALFNPTDILISNDGLDVYVMGCGTGDNIGGHFQRDPLTGDLTLVERFPLPPNDLPLGCPARPTLSPDMRNLYIGFFNSDSVLVYERNLTTGRLTIVEGVVDGIDGVELSRPLRIAVSPDGRRLYAGQTVFLRDETSGLLTQEQRITEVAFVAFGAVVSSESQHVYFVNGFADTLFVFVRQPINRISSSRNVGFIEEGMRLELTAPAGVSNQWKLGGVDLVEDPPRLTGTTSQVLTFDPVLESDAGTYTVLYEDGMTKAIVETEPFDLDVLPPGSLPAAGMIALGLLTGALAMTAATKLRRKQ